MHLEEKKWNIPVPRVCFSDTITLNQYLIFPVNTAQGDTADSVIREGGCTFKPVVSCLNA